MNHSVRAVVLALLGVAGACGAAEPEWERLTNCRLIENASNDGDSFHVRAGGKEHIFRLYFVDAPETRALREFTARTTDQSRYWGIRKAALFDVADAATVFTAAQLAAPFVVFTKWEDAQGNSRQSRNYAIIKTAGGGDLAELLVEAGLARIYGHRTDHPDGITAEPYLRKLERLEEAARKAQRGAWAGADPASASTSKSKSTSKPKGSSTPASSGTSVDDLPAF